MSNLDTTLREKFYKWYSEQWVANEGVYPDRTDIADFFLSEFHQVMNEKVAVIEAMKEHEDGTPVRMVDIDDVLSILKD